MYGISSVDMAALSINYTCQFGNSEGNHNIEVAMTLVVKCICHHCTLSSQRGDM